MRQGQSSKPSVKIRSGVLTVNSTGNATRLLAASLLWMHTVALWTPTVRAVASSVTSTLAAGSPTSTEPLAGASASHGTISGVAQVVVVASAFHVNVAVPALAIVNGAFVDAPTSAVPLKVAGPTLIDGAPAAATVITPDMPDPPL